MNAPSFATIEVTALKWGGEYSTVVRFQWDMAGRDSLPVDHFIILRKKQSSDTAFNEGILDIPDSVSEYWDKLIPSDFPRQGTYTNIWYRIFAVDTQGRSGDTSAPDSVQLSWPPSITAPVDTLRNGLFKWSTVLYLGGYYTSLYLWSDSLGFLWKSLPPAEPTYGHETADSQFLVLPSPPAPLAAGRYFCGVKVEIPGANIQSMALRQFYVP
jgi:hypothetical protein